MHEREREREVDEIRLSFVWNVRKWSKEIKNQSWEV